MGSRWYDLAVVARERMEFWMRILSEAGVKPAMLVPETYGLARIPGTTSLLVAEDQVFFNDVVVPVENRVGPEGDGWRVTGPVEDR